MKEKILSVVLCSMILVGCGTEVKQDSTTTDKAQKVSESAEVEPVTESVTATEILSQPASTDLSSEEIEDHDTFTIDKIAIKCRKPLKEGYFDVDQNMVTLISEDDTNIGGSDDNFMTIGVYDADYNIDGFQAVISKNHKNTDKNGTTFYSAEGVEDTNKYLAYPDGDSNDKGKLVVITGNTTDFYQYVEIWHER